MRGAPRVDNATLPEAIRVPAGHVQSMHTTGSGEITYECREKKDMAGTYEWAFVAPVATLYSRDRQAVGKYYAGPTWEARDGSKVTGKQLAVAPGGAGNIPLQLVKAEPATPAMPQPRPKVNRSTRSVLMPVAPAIMRFCTTARTWRPQRDLYMI